MKKRLFIAFLFASHNVGAQGQHTELITSPTLFPANDSVKDPDNYAKSKSERYTQALHLNDKQRKQAYRIIKQNKVTMDSLVKNGIHVEAGELWALYNSMDEKFRSILTPTQYRYYELIDQTNENMNKMKRR
jgi:hypothetical protein